ncbi:MAG: C-terminal target protein, partial [Verrucomicrobiaceae bacterium]|nr:C-terminal target protein [Verrucomicrobiaceae bacterium]
MKSFFLSAFLLTLLGGGHLVAQTSVLGKNWTLQRPKPTADNLKSIAVNGTASIVVVGGHGTILTAPALTGTNAWNLNAVTGLTADLWDIVYTGNGNKYIAVGSSGTILTATDTLSTTPAGLTWTAIATSTADAAKLNPTDQYNAVDSSGSVVVAAGATAAGGGVVAISTDGGTTWVRRLVASSTSLKDVTFQNSTLWAVMDGYLLRSTNAGVSWTKFTLGTTTTVTSVAYAVPAAQSTSPALNVTGSTSFIAINGGTLNIGTAPANLAVVSTGTELIGVTRAGALVHSDNAGVSWGTLSATQTTPFNKATRFGSTYVAVGDGGAIRSYVLGGNWTALTNVGSILPANGIAWNEKVGADSLIVAVGKGITWTSADSGVSWTEHIQTMPNTTTPMTMYAVMWSGSYFVAVGNGLWVSSDGVSWTSQQTPPTPGAVYAVSRLNGTPYALGYDATKKLVNVSAGDLQGYAWSTFTAIPGAQWAMLGLTKSDAGLYVAAGWGGRVLTNTSPGIKAWSAYTVALTAGEDFTDVLWANNQFTAVTSKGGIWTSTNGSAWVKRMTASQPLWCITRVKHAAGSGKDDQFIAAGNHGLLVTSFNGQEWQESDTGSSQFTNQILSMPSTEVKTITHTDSQVVTTVTTSYTLDTTAHTLTTNVKR